MFSLHELKLLDSLLALSCWACVWPLHWDPKVKRLSVSRFFKLKSLIIHIIILFNIFYIIFLIVKLYLDVSGITDPEGHTYQFRIFHILFTLIHIILAGIHIGSILNYEELIDFVNQLLYFNMESGRTFFGIEFLPPAQVEKRVRLLHLFLASLSSSAVFLIIAFPVTHNNSYYIYSALCSKWRNGWTFSIFYLMETWIILDTLLVMTIVQVLGYIYYVSTNFWLEKSCWDWPLSDNPADHQVQKLDLFKSLRLLNNLYNQVFSQIWLPVLKGTCTTFALIDIYGMVRLMNILPLLIYLYLPVIYGFFSILFVTATSLMAELYHHSILLEKHWERHTLQLGLQDPIPQGQRSSGAQSSNSRVSSTGNSGVPIPKNPPHGLGKGKGKKFYRKFLKACRPLRCEIGPYFIKRVTKITLLGLLINGGISVLLTFQ